MEVCHERAGASPGESFGLPGLSPPRCSLPSATALLTISFPPTAGLLVLLAPGLVPSVAGMLIVGTFVPVLLLYVGVVGALYLAFQVFTVDQGAKAVSLPTAEASSWCRWTGDLHRVDAWASSR